MLSQVRNFIDSFGMYIVLALCVVMFFRTCSTASTVGKIEKKVDQIESSSSTVSKQEVDSILKTRLYEFLIFEEDLDRGKTSLSDIRLKISKDEK
jgi:hypothetical protein